MRKTDRYVHWLANKVLNLASEDYRVRLNNLIVVGHIVFAHSDLFELVFDRAKKDLDNTKRDDVR